MFAYPDALLIVPLGLELIEISAVATKVGAGDVRGFLTEELLQYVPADVWLCKLRVSVGSELRGKLRGEVRGYEER